MAWVSLGSITATYPDWTAIEVPENTEILRLSSSNQFRKAWISFVKSGTQPTSGKFKPQAVTFGSPVYILVPRLESNWNLAIAARLRFTRFDQGREVQSFEISVSRWANANG